MILTNACHIFMLLQVYRKASFFLFHTVYKQKRLPYYRATFFKHNNQFSSELKQLDYLLIVV